MNFSDQVLVAAISTLGGVVATYITVKFRKDNTSKVKKEPKSRMDNIFDGYERLILQLTTDMERKEGSIVRMEKIIDELESELYETKQLLQATKVELHESQKQKKELSAQLKMMREEYSQNKK